MSIYLAKFGVCFMKTAQERQRVLDLIAQHNDGPGALIQVLNAIQQEDGYLPKEVQQLVAAEMGIPFSKVFEVVSFYSRFTVEKRGKYEVSVCMGTACYVRSAQDVLEAFKSRLCISENQTTPDGLFTIVSCRCVGACALAPVVSVNGDVFGKVDVRDVAGILEKYK